MPEECAAYLGMFLSPRFILACPNLRLGSGVAVVKAGSTAVEDAESQAWLLWAFPRRIYSLPLVSGVFMWPSTPRNDRGGSRKRPETCRWRYEALLEM
jgi:hypothetical protein